MSHRIQRWQVKNVAHYISQEITRALAETSAKNLTAQDMKRLAHNVLR